MGRRLTDSLFFIYLTGSALSRSDWVCLNVLQKMRLILLTILLSLSSVDAQLLGYRDKGTGLQFAEAIAGYILVRDPKTKSPVERFDDPRLGYSIAYSSPKSEVTIYAFNGGAPSIKDGVKGDWVNRYFKQALDEVTFYESEGYYSNVETQEVGEQFAAIVPDGFLAQKLTYSIVVEEPEQKVKSYIFCRGINNLVFKVRATGQADFDFEASLSKLLQGFLKQVTE